jgi:hypothetical protein
LIFDHHSVWHLALFRQYADGMPVVANMRMALFDCGRSEVRIEGGRVIGGRTQGKATTVAEAIAGPIGIHVTGNNGGVHVVSTDVIGLGIGMLLDDSSGQGSNRETFVSHGTFDSDGVGILVRDSSYLSIAGCWAASSDVAQIWLAPTATNAVLSIAGGTIFNGGTYFAQPASRSSEAMCPIAGGCSGLVVDAGTFTLTGVIVRNNRGAGIAVRPQPWTNTHAENKSVGDPVKSVGVTTDVGSIALAHSSYFTVTGCQIYGNGQGMAIEGASFAITGNVLHDNQNESKISTVDGSSPPPVVANNVGL